jgi:quercetin dioxygenase-like cupin family protein
MKVFRSSEVEFRDADANTFAGFARMRLLGSAEEGTPVHVYHVEFGNGGRTNWHIHSGAQWLLVIQGRIRVQVWGEPPLDIAAGDAVMFPPGEKHWHGASPGGGGAHLAVNVQVKTEWLEKVTDEDYER